MFFCHHRIMVYRVYIVQLYIRYSSMYIYMQCTGKGRKRTIPTQPEEGAPVTHHKLLLPRWTRGGVRRGCRSAVGGDRVPQRSAAGWSSGVAAAR